MELFQLFLTIQLQKSDCTFVCNWVIRIHLLSYHNTSISITVCRYAYFSQGQGGEVNCECLNKQKTQGIRLSRLNSFESSYGLIEMFMILLSFPKEMANSTVLKKSL